MKTSPTAGVRELYEATADSYATMMDSEIELPVYADTLARLAERIAELPGPVLDTSCGSGHMLLRYRDRYEPARSVVGIDLSPRMVGIARAKLGGNARISIGDMRDLVGIESGSAAAVVSFFAIHHLAPKEIPPALREWRRVLGPRGQLLVAAWEGTGPIDYGDESSVVALRYTRDEIVTWSEGAGFDVDRCRVEPVDGIPMDVVYLEGTRAS